MSTYVVGDIQGCYDPLMALLDSVNFDPTYDRLISVGDLVNRGTQNLSTIRYCKSLGSSFSMVLGNHDLHLLAIAEGVREPTPKDTIQDILYASDTEELLQWLRNQPLLMEVDGYHIVHAGIPHIWSIQESHQLASEVSTIIQSEQRKLYFQHMYGNSPKAWSNNLQGPERWRVITNYLTRMRFCSADGELDLIQKETVDMAPPLQPWFRFERPALCSAKIVFGHWAALQGRDCGKNLFALDTGCIWGGPLRAMKLETQEYYHFYPH